MELINEKERLQISKELENQLVSLDEALSWGETFVDIRLKSFISAMASAGEGVFRTNLLKGVLSASEFEREKQAYLAVALLCAEPKLFDDERAETDDIFSVAQENHLVVPLMSNIKSPYFVVQEAVETAKDQSPQDLISSDDFVLYAIGLTREALAKPENIQVREIERQFGQFVVEVTEARDNVSG